MPQNAKGVMCQLCNYHMVHQVLLRSGAWQFICILCDTRIGKPFGTQLRDWQVPRKVLIKSKFDI